MSTDTLNISIDSRFRDNPDSSTDSQFTITLAETYRNITQIEVVSTEIPTLTPSFSTNDTTIIQVRRGPDVSGLWTHHEWNTIYLPSGNYSATELTTELQHLIGTTLGFSQSAADPVDQGFIVTADKESGHIQMYINLSSAEWGVTSDTEIDSFDIHFTPIDLNAAYTYGVVKGDIIPGTSTSYLEELKIYSSAIHTWASSIPRGTNTLRDYLGFSDFMYYGLSVYTGTDHFNLFGCPYVLLQVNNYDTIDHITNGGVVKCFAKMSLNERGNDNGPEFGGGYSFSHTRNSVSFPKTFDQPENITRFEITLLTPTGNIIDLLGSHFSVTFRIHYIRDSHKYEIARNQYIGPTHIKKNNSKLRNIRFHN
jgi:hypothetical protein